MRKHHAKPATGLLHPDTDVQCKYCKRTKTQGERIVDDLSFSRDYYGSNELSKAAFGRYLALFTLLGGILVAVGAFFTYRLPMDWALSMGGNTVPGFLVLLGSAFLVALVSGGIAGASDSPKVSAVAIAIMDVSLGAMSGPAIAPFLAVVVPAFLITGGVFLVMCLLGAAFPRFFTRSGVFLLAALTWFLVVSFGAIGAWAFGLISQDTFGVVNYVLASIGILLFAGFIAFDWARALNGERTLDKAIDASGGLVLDALNIFLRLLPILLDVFQQ